MRLQPNPSPAPRALQGIGLRSIGPALASGRIQDVVIDPRNPSVWYVATAFGGLWKTINRGITFAPIFDDQGSFTLCCVAIDPRDSNIVWVGSGENTSQRSAHFGDGVYKSTDGGKNWKRVGLATSEHIGRILIDPRNSNTVYVASQGPLWSAGGERGLYKTTDGGATWTAVLTISPDTGVSDVVFHPKNPDTLYASSYQRRRAVGQMIGGGPEGGIFKSTNAGRTWTKLKQGLPKDDVGRVALAVDPRHPSAVFALISAKGPRGRGGGIPAPPGPQANVVDEAGFYRSDDAGESWSRIGRVSSIVRDTAPSGASGDTRRPRRTCRASGIAAAAPRTTTSCSSTLIGRTRSTRSIPTSNGAVMAARPGAPHGWEDTGMHVDHHALAFDPSDRNHILVGNDGGLYETYDEGATFRFFTNLPVTQLLPRVGRQCEAVLQRVWRGAGQLVRMRSVAHDQPLGDTQQRLVHRRQRRRLSDSQRPGGSGPSMRVRRTAT